MQERMTEQKRVVHEELKRSDRPLTVGELHGRVHETLPLTAVSTVYRILERMVATGRAMRSTGPDGEFFFTYVGNETRPLIQCTVCHKLFPVTGHVFEKIFEQLAKATGFLFPDLPVQFPGICPECQMKKTAK
jgi:Fe2+ or Zn2+ uptake regulation protein